MNLFLILDTKQTSHDAETIWHDACADSSITLQVLKPDNPQYQALVEQLHLNSFPALVQNQRVLAVGIPTLESAKKLLSELTAP